MEDAQSRREEAIRQAIEKDEMRAVCGNVMCAVSGLVPDTYRYPQVALAISGFAIKRFQNFRGPKVPDYLSAMIASARLPYSITVKLVSNSKKAIFPFAHVNTEKPDPFVYRPNDVNKPKYRALSGQIVAHLGHLALAHLVKPITEENKQYISSRLAAMRNSGSGPIMLEPDLCDIMLDITELDKLSAFILGKGLKTQIVLAFLVAGTTQTSTQEEVDAGVINTDINTKIKEIPDLASKLGQRGNQISDKVSSQALSPLERGYYLQWNMMTAGFGMNTMDKMISFCTESHSLALYYNAVCKEIIQLHAAYSKYAKKYGAMFRYMRVLELPGCEELQNSLYPNLYTVATEWFKSSLPEDQAKQYKTSSVKTSMPSAELKKLALHQIRACVAIGGEDAKQLCRIGAPNYSKGELKEAAHTYKKVSNVRIDLDYRPARSDDADAGTSKDTPKKRRQESSSSSGESSNESSEDSDDIRRMRRKLKKHKKAKRKNKKDKSKTNRKDRSTNDRTQDSPSNV